MEKTKIIFFDIKDYDKEFFKKSLLSLEPHSYIKNELV